MAVVSGGALWLCPGCCTATATATAITGRLISAGQSRARRHVSTPEASPRRPFANGTDKGRRAAAVVLPWLSASCWLVFCSFFCCTPYPSVSCRSLTAPLHRVWCLVSGACLHLCALFCRGNRPPAPYTSPRHQRSLTVTTHGHTPWQAPTPHRLASRRRQSATRTRTRTHTRRLLPARLT